METLQNKLNVERRELSEKIDILSQEITRKDKANTTLEGQKESLNKYLQDQTNQNKVKSEEFAKEKVDLCAKINELKSKLDEKEDDLTQKKIDFERERALKQQEVHFTEQKAKDLSDQLASATSENHKRNQAAIG